MLKENIVWLGYKSLNQDMYFNVTNEYKAWLLYNKKEGSAYKIIDGIVMGRLASACWFTNIDHGKRHEVLQLDTMAHNLKYNKKLKKRFDSLGVVDYPQYDNYDAIEVPFMECIPSDYEGMMGVPITFMDSFNPEQFEIDGYCASHGKLPKGIPNESPYMFGGWVYNRILIHHKKGATTP